MSDPTPRRPLVVRIGRSPGRQRPRHSARSSSRQAATGTKAPDEAPFAWRPAAPGDGTVQLGFAGVVAGCAIPVAYIAWLNRGGPGQVCQVRPESSSCFDALNPLPIAGVAVLLLLGAALILRAGLRARTAARATGTRVRSPWLGVAWVVVGATGCLGMLSLLTIGIFVLPLAVLLAVGLGGLTARPARST